VADLSYSQTTQTIFTTAAPPSPAFLFILSFFPTTVDRDCQPIAIDIIDVVPTLIGMVSEALLGRI
jgi:hypothetical protein